jgi:uncharacterized glyoxalase superfamily protein PhnB
MGAVGDLTDVCTLIQVYDMLESMRFYEQYLGFHAEQQAPYFEQPYPHVNWALLVRGNLPLMLNTAWEAEERPPARAPAWVASHRDVTLHFGCPDVDGAYEALRAGGLDLAPPTIARYGMKQLAFKDPDGYGICLQWRV